MDGIGALEVTDAIDFHESISATWADRYSKPSFLSRDTLIGDLMKTNIREGEHWLDLGCGTGQFLTRFVQAGATVIGIDGASGMLAEAGRTCGDAVGISLVLGDARAIPLDDATVDGVLCISLVEYLDDGPAGLAEIVRVMRPGSKLILVVPNADSLQRRAIGVLHRVSGKPTWYGLSRFAENERGYRQLLAALGLVLHSVTAFGGRFQRWQRNRRVGTLLALVAATGC
jgi:ubiquinone/menaquinone biosynthesis C-methylase UbiE